MIKTLQLKNLHVLISTVIYLKKNCEVIKVVYIVTFTEELWNYKSGLHCHIYIVTFTCSNSLRQTKLYFE